MQWKRYLTVAVLVVAPLVCFPLFPKHGAALAVFFSIIPLWFAELLPLPVTALLVPVLCALYGALPAGQAFQAFGSDILFLFIGCFWLTKAMQKHGWDRRMANFVLSRKFAGGSPSRLLLLMALCAFTLGMWVSNTATTAIMVAVSLGVIHSLKERFSSQEMWERFSLRLLLTCAFSASIGGIATPVGTPPNLIVLEFLAQHNLKISFVEWMARGVPVSLTILVLMLLALEWSFPLRMERLVGLQEHFSNELARLGPLKTAELQVAGVFVMMVALWILPGLAVLIFPQSFALVALEETLTISVVGIGCALLLFLLPYRKDAAMVSNLTWEDARDIDWGTILLFGGGLCLGRMLEKSGVALFIGEALFSAGTESLLLIALCVVVLSVLMSEISSGTATASVVVPVLIPSLVGALGLPPETAVVMGLGCAFSVSLGFMLPVSTPPNAIIFGTGMVPLRALVRAGLLLDIIGIVVVISWIMLSVAYS